MIVKYLPDEAIIQALEHQRGRGRNDYPVAAMWRAVLAGIIFQHCSIESLVRELRRNPALLAVCGFDPLPQQGRPVTRVARNARNGKIDVVSQAAAPRDSIHNC